MGASLDVQPLLWRFLLTGGGSQQVPDILHIDLFSKAIDVIFPGQEGSIAVLWPMCLCKKAVEAKMHVGKASGTMAISHTLIKC